jgi:hypothetical protein
MQLHQKIVFFFCCFCFWKPTSAGWEREVLFVIWYLWDWCWFIWVCIVLPQPMMVSLEICIHPTECILQNDKNRFEGFHFCAPGKEVKDLILFLLHNSSFVVYNFTTYIVRPSIHDGLGLTNFFSFYVNWCFGIYVNYAKKNDDDDDDWKMKLAIRASH